MEYKIGNANDFQQTEINSFKKIVLGAGEVGSKTFDGLISKNPILLFLPNTNTIHAVGALKLPNANYKKELFKKSKSKFNPDEFQYELGWIVSLKEGKGNGKLITKILANYKSKIYATVRYENEKMRHILGKNGFVETGETFKSERGNYYLMLYVSH